jgi:hypothetical protein
MRRLLTLVALLLTLNLSSALADRQSFGAWSVALDTDIEPDIENGVRAFRGKDVTYLFTPPEPLGNRTLETIAAATIKDITQGKGSVRLAGQRTDEDGATLRAYSGVVPDANTGRSIHSYLFFAKNGQWGLALLISNPNADINAATETLGTATFNPPGLSGKQETLPRLSAVPWSVPRPDRTASTRPELSYPAARRVGLNPEQDLLPVSFECYFVGEYAGDELRAMTPTPDLRIGVSKDGRYAFTDGAVKAQGTWTQNRAVGDRHTLSLSGPLVAREVWVYGDDDAGQRFNAVHIASDRRVSCYQSGPAAETLRLALTKRRIGSEPLSCQNTKGGAPYRLEFSAGSYRTPAGTGRARLAFSGTTGDSWEGLAQFAGGPLDVFVGEMTEDENGNRELRVVERTTTSRGMFYSESSTTLRAVCRAKVTPRPSLLYGQDRAPKTGVTGGPDGLFVSNQQVFGMIGNIPNTRTEAQLSLFTPGGYLLSDIDPTDLGSLPDCTRTRPNGDPYCQRYTLNAGKLQMEGDDESELFKKTTAGFTLGDTEYFRLTPLSSTTLAGIYSTNTDTGSGPAGGLIGGGVGVYNSLESGYRFTEGGQVSWKYSSSSSTLISPSLITGGGASGGGSSSRQDGGQGRYTFKDHWLTLTFTDGRVQRLFVYAQPPQFLKGDPTLGERLNIGGSWLRRVGKP